ncbi:MAG: hypothetical protein PHH47_02535 [Gallionella sp.]|nr:hypothetical protein [Gallionella sp.]MDD4946075.1 hypothetical protein [Gallionella sp.]MDD5613372.1 hypothetical protein [Gallionella sp.]
MLTSLRRGYTQLITSGAQLLLMLIGLRMQSYTVWLYCLSLMALVSVFAWQSALRRLRAIRDTPTSKAASAAQGYVELSGRGEPYGEFPLISHLRGLPCLWYRYTIERRTSKNKWITEARGASYQPFQLRDESGVCVVDPEQAEIITQHRDQWREGDYRYTEWKLIKYDTIYVLGEFRSYHPGTTFDSRSELNMLLAEWKKDMPELHRRFDLDGNGQLDEDEWMLARQAARREVAHRQAEANAQPETHLIGLPNDGKLFLISNLTPDKLARRYLLWSLAHLVILFGALAGCGWAWRNGIF